LGFGLLASVLGLAPYPCSTDGVVGEWFATEHDKNNEQCSGEKKK